MTGAGLYVHIPFCVHKCAYCDFASGVFEGLAPPRYLGALEAELASLPSPEINTVFVGGGTPSLLDPEDLRRLLRAVSAVAPRAEEWTVEANPNSLTRDKALILRDAGVTRLSLGVQSLDPDELTFLERQHDVTTAHNAMNLAEEIFPGNWSADLIFGIPNQTDSSWRQTLEGVLDHAPRHVSTYELTWEPTTPLGQRLKRGELHEEPDDTILGRMAACQNILGGAGLHRYEVSNWSRDNESRCLHNDLIWLGGDYFAIGNGAHGRSGDRRWRNTASPHDYVERLESGRSLVAEEDEDATDADRLATRLLLGLRRRNGITISRASELWPDLAARWGQWIRQDGDRLVCTAIGWNLLDRLIVELLKAAAGKICRPTAG